MLSDGWLLIINSVQVIVITYRESKKETKRNIKQFIIYLGSIQRYGKVIGLIFWLFKYEINVVKTKFYNFDPLRLTWNRKKKSNKIRKNVIIGEVRE